MSSKMVSTRLVLSGHGWRERGLEAKWLTVRLCSFTTEGDQREQQQWDVKMFHESHF